jgi:hypothetical protein
VTILGFCFMATMIMQDCAFLVLHHCFLILHGAMPLIHYGESMVNQTHVIKEWTFDLRNKVVWETRDKFGI